ncbi:LOW QUALITY PROTEIN: Hypothetical protein PHPALM_15762 [Phytophthora palmivora]|uniref:MULE transposase domain-containing protein n=1 Tax=Phytophthora palmivora TaxID=4796 RepID=A0A2P4XRK3_9STRA|nr:LOW QUALITY PROTEIN: Hypothetical protein PHPALM_15762 [Phytophthora palmivora]
MFDPRTKLYLPVFFSLMTSRTQDSYKRLLHCIEFAVGSKPDINRLVCNFESALIFAVREHFLESRIVGCLFHLKQAWRRKMKSLRLPNIEVSNAMQKGVLDMLTVVDPEKWKSKESPGIWISKFPPDYWNVYGMQRAIVNRTNSPLERYHRELNTRFKVPYPALVKFVDRILHNPTSFSGKASFQKMLTHPRENRSNSQELLDISDIKDSDSEEDGDDSPEMSSTAAVVEYEEYNYDEELNVSDDSYEADQYGPPGEEHACKELLPELLELLNDEEEQV